MAKKYFWLKLKDDFFTDIRMKKLRRNAGGAIYTVIYLKLQLLSLKNEGILFYEEVEDSFFEEIAMKIDEEPVDVEFTLMFLMKHKLLEEVRENEYALIETMSSIGSETDVASRVRKHRELKESKQKTLQCNAIETIGNTEKEKEKEKEKENKNIVVQDELERDFQDFYSNYPIKKGKANAVKAYKKARKNKNTHEQIMNGLFNYKRELDLKGTDKQFIKQPATFLNGEHFNDEYDLVTVMQNGKQLKPWEVSAYEPTTSWNDNVNDRGSISKPVPNKQLGINF